MPKKGPLKVTPFSLFMKIRKPQLMRQGHRFPGGWKEVAEAVNIEWKNMKESERQKWTKRAQDIKSSGSAHFNDKPKGCENPTCTLYEDEKKNVPKVHHVEVALVESELKQYLDEHLSELGTSNFPLVHFNQYCSTQEGYAIPAEYMAVVFNLKDGVVKRAGSLFDPGENEEINSLLCDVLESKDALHLPRPKYSISNTELYGFGEDDCDQVLKNLETCYLVFRGSNSVDRRVIFALEENLLTVENCIKWLQKENGFDSQDEIAVFPFEKFISLLSLKLVEADWPGKVKPVYHSIPDVKYALNEATLEYSKHIACLWHQQDQNVSGVKTCSSNIVKRSIHNALKLFAPLYNLDTFEHLRKMKSGYVGNLNPSERIAALEFKQRFGFLPVSSKRRRFLEHRFINPKFLDELMKRYPDGLPSQPKVIIWPSNRNIELDLNYNLNATVYIRDLNPNYNLECLPGQLGRRSAAIKIER